MKKRSGKIISLGLALFTGWSSAVLGAEFQFQLDGAHAHPATTSEGTGYGSFAFTSPGTIGINLTYSGLSSPVHEVIGYFGRTEVFRPGIGWSGTVLTFHTQSVDGQLPPSGSLTRTRTGAFIDQRLLDSLNAGLVYVTISTDTYRFACCGEIGGIVAVPEPSVLSLAAIGGGLAWMARWCSRRRRNDDGASS